MLLGCLALPSLAESPDFLIDHWGTADGLPVNGINRVAVTGQGYLWLATFDGLVRFDGHNFQVFRTGSTHLELPSNRIVELVETNDGQLWLLTEGHHLVRFDGQRFHIMGEAQGLPARTGHLMTLDGQGTLWVELADGLARRLEDNEFRILEGSQSLGRIYALLNPGDGSLLAATDHGLARFVNDRLERLWGPEDGLSLPTRSLALDGDGLLWVGADGRLMRETRDGGFEQVMAPLTAWQIHQGANGMDVSGGRSDYRIGPGDEVEKRRRDARFFGTGHETIRRQAPDGSVWRNGLDRLERNGVVVFDAPCTIMDFDFDGVGGAWVATACDGLYRVRPSVIKAVTELDGVPLGSTYGLAETHDTRLWIGTLDRGVAILSPDGEVRWLGEEDGVAHFGLHALWRDVDDSVWIGSCRVNDHRCELPDGWPRALGLYADVRAVHRDAIGDLWFGGLELWRYRESDGWQSMMEASGLPAGLAGGVRVMHETRDGSLWFGTHASGLLRRDPQGAFTRLTRSDGLASDSIRALEEDRQGYLWVATEDRGLCQLEPDRQPLQPRCLDSRRGLWSDSLNQVLEDDHRRLWFNTNQGVFVLPLAALHAALGNADVQLHPQVYTERDGLPSREGNGGVAGAGIRLRDGRFAFPTQNGVALFHPDDFMQPSQPVRAVFERISLPDGHELPAGNRVRLPPGVRNFGVHYTGLAAQLTDPVYFRYRFARDRAWSELGDVRQLSLQRLAPGTHELELVAFGAGGALGPPARIELELPRWWYEKTGVRLAAVVFMMMLGLAVLWRRQQLAGQHRRLLEDTVSSRTIELREALETVHDQRDEIARLADSKAQFFANVSHELRTPLTLLLGPVDDLAEGRALSPERIRAMQHSGHRLERLIGQLLDLERIDARRFPLEMQALDLAALLRENVEAFMPLATRAEISLRLVEPLPVAQVRGDREQLVRVLANLLSNAVKFCPRGGQVEARLVARGGQLELCIDDSGPGIAPAWRESVFDRFTQMRNASTRGHEGTGLGLALSREVAALHGGELYCTDSPLGGARFVFRLPSLNASGPAVDLAAGLPVSDAGKGQGLVRPAVLQSAPADPAPPIPGDSASGGARPADQADVATGGEAAELPQVLLVEDHAELRQYLAEMLADDYRVLVAVDGVDGLQQAEQHLPDLIVTDLMMPRLDGLGLARGVRRNPALAGVPVIFLTARASDADRVAGFQGGADYYLAKPVRRAVLLAQLAAALRACHRLRDSHARQGQSRDTASHADALPSDRFGARLQSVLEARAHDPDLVVADLARALHMSESGLRRACQKSSSATPGELLRRYRLARAQQLLGTAQGTVSEVAYAVGYSSLSSFSRAYREEFGHPPSVAQEDR